MKKKRQIKTVRRCTICDKTGHNARTCPLRSQKKQIAKKKPAKKKVNKNQEKYIKINLVNRKDVNVSPYIINLEKEDKNKVLEMVSPYQENKKEKQIRKTVNFSELIREHKIKKVLNKKIVETKKIEKSTEGGSVLVGEVKIDILAEIAKIQNTKNKIKLNLERKEKNKIDFKKILNNFKFDFSPNLKNIFKPRKINFDFTWNWRKMAFSSIVLFLLVALPYPSFSFYKQVEYDTARVVNKSSNAFLSLQSSTISVLNSNVDQAEYDLNEALNYFGGAEKIIENEYKSLVYIAKLMPFLGKKISARQDLLEAGHKIALGNTYLVKAINEIQEKEDLSLLEKINIAKNHIDFAYPNYKEAQDKIKNVDETNVPVEYQSTFSEFKSIYGAFVNDMENMSETVDALELVMGSESFKRYLILFQNQNEIRASGGFVGSFAILDVQNGKILDIDIPGGGSYDLQGQLDEYVLPPLPLQTVNKRWEFQDGNWFSNFPDTAKKMEWFYKNSRNSTVDGVIAINASVLTKILEVLGPIENSEYNLILDSNNALQDLQYEIENYSEDENTPKAVLSSLFDQLFNSLEKIEAKQMFSLMFNFYEALEEKEIQVYFKDVEIQELFSKYSWTGEIQKTEDQDYLYVVNSNIGGGKSDFNIEQTIEHQAYVEEDGSIIDTVIITRKHKGEISENFFGDTNVDYVRLYVPQGSELLEAGGFTYPDEESFQFSPEWYREDLDLLSIEKNKKIDDKNGTVITTEYDKTVFGNWIMTHPGEEQKIYFVYKLPFNAFIDKKEDQEKNIINIFDREKNISNYDIIFQKQSGINSKLNHTIIYPDNWAPVWKTDDNLKVSKNGAELNTVLQKDMFYGILMKKIN